MNLFKAHKDKKKTNAEIIASVEEEDILYEDKPAAITAPQEPTPAPVEEPVVETPVEEKSQVEELPVEEPVEEVVEEEPVQEEEPVEEVIEEEPVQEEEPVEEVVEEEPVQEEEPVEEVVEEEPVQEEEPVEEVIEEEPVQEEEPIEEVIEEPFVEEKSQVEELPVEEVVEEEPTEEAPIIDIVIPDVEPVQEEIAKEPVYQPTFAEKMNIADEDIQRRYDELKNYALRFKKLTWRISKKYDSINLGRFQFVKLSVAGKTLKLNLNMDISEADPKYHCVDKRSTKTYEDVPCQMRIKSDRGLKYAKELIDYCAEKHGLVENPKFTPVDSLELIARHLELGDTDDIIIEYQDDEE